jgi:hypothetical protein
MPAMEVASSEHEMPCHGSGETTPEDESGAHDDCGCERLTQWLPAAPSSTGGVVLSMSSPSAIVETTPIARRAAHRPPRHVFDRALGIPPPDLLLLNSTFLI